MGCVGHKLVSGAVVILYALAHTVKCIAKLRYLAGALYVNTHISLGTHSPNGRSQLCYGPGQPAGKYGYGNYHCNNNNAKHHSYPLGYRHKAVHHVLNGSGKQHGACNRSVLHQGNSIIYRPYGFFIKCKYALFRASEDVMESICGILAAPQYLPHLPVRQKGPVLAGCGIHLHHRVRVQHKNAPAHGLGPLCYIGKKFIGIRHVKIGNYILSKLSSSRKLSFCALGYQKFFHQPGNCAAYGNKGKHRYQQVHPHHAPADGIQGLYGFQLIQQSNSQLPTLSLCIADLRDPPRFFL